MREIARTIARGAGAVCLALLDYALFAVLFIVVSVAHLISFGVRGLRKLFGASSSDQSRK